MHGVVECMCSLACGADVTIRDVTIKIPDRNATRDVNDVMPGRAEDFGDLKKAIS